jgi:peptide/nickel transport system substrate-binding protein
MHGNPPGLDPHKVGNFAGQAAYSHMYSTLLVRDEKLAPKAHVAESWDASSDGLTYTFKIRSGIKFHNGRELTADDVRYSIERIRDPKTTSPWAGNLSMVDQVATIDPRTVRVTLKYPTGLFLKAVALQAAGAIVAKEVVEQNGDLQRIDGGSGPFKLKQWEPNSFVEMERFDQYFEKDLPYVDGIRWRILPEPATRQAALRSGQLDWAWFDRPEWEQLAGDAALVRVELPAFTLSDAQLNYTHKPLDDVRVRQALNISVDRRDLISRAFGAGEPSAYVPLGHPSGHALAQNELPGYFEKPLIDQAKKLLSDAGVASGLKVTVIAFPSTALICQVLQSQWKSIGVDLDIQQREIAAGLADWNAGKWDIFVGAAGFLNVDPDGYLYPYFHSSAPAMGGITPLKDEQVDSLLDKGRRQAEGAERRQTYVDVQKRLLDQAARIPFAATRLFEVTSKRVQGYDPKPGISYVYRSMGTFSRAWLSS